MAFSKHFYPKGHTHVFIQTFIAESTMQGNSQLIKGQRGLGVLLRATSTIEVRRAGDQTSNLPVTRHPAIPPELV